MYQAVRADYSNATDLADYLTAKGMPFRHSHETVGRIVLHCINHHNYLQDLTLDEFQTFSDLIEEDILMHWIRKPLSMPADRQVELHGKV